MTNTTPFGRENQSPAGHGSIWSRGDERIRTAVCAPSTDAAYVPCTCTLACEPRGITEEQRCRLREDVMEDTPRFNEVARREHDGRVLVCYGARGWYMIANEDDVTRQSVVLTTDEVRWLAELWRPSDDEERRDA